MPRYRIIAIALTLVLCTTTNAVGQESRPASQPASQPATDQTPPKRTAPVASGARLLAPRMPGSVTADGALTTDEWHGAAEHTLPSGAKLLLRHDAAGVGIGIRSEKQGVLTIFLELDGKVFALHSSARLGTAIYETRGDGEAPTWHPVQQFEYEYPSDEYYATHGWRSSIGEPRGKGDIECLLSRKLLGLDKSPAGKKAKERTTPQQITLRIVHAPLGASRLPAWPQNAEDDTQNTRLLMGHSPVNLTFEPASWGTLVLKSESPKK